MKVKLALFLVLTFSLSVFAQKTMNDTKKGRHYIPLKLFKKKYATNFTKKDSLNFKIRKNDTLVLVPKGYDPMKNGVPYEPKDSVFLEIYKDLVYNKSNMKESIGKRKIYMRLWSKPIKIFFSNSVDEKYREVITNLSRKLTKEVDSLDISVVKELEESNYVVYQIDELNSYKYSKNVKNNKYISYYSFWDNSRIYDTKLEINVTKYKNKQVNVNYVMQYFVASLGHFYKSAKLPCNNTFSNCKSDEKNFTNKDLEFLKYHYSYGIGKGIDLETFESTHSRIKEEFSKTGLYPIIVNKIN